MTLSTLFWWILAEDENKQPAAEGPGIGSFLLPMVAIFAVYYFLMIRPRSNKEKARRSALDELKKNDRVHTIGGILGTITGFSSDGREVTIRVDDNSRITMLRSAIHGVYSPDSDDEKDGKK